MWNTLEGTKYQKLRKPSKNQFRKKLYKFGTTMQGDFLKLLIEEKENVTWQALIRNVPRGIMSFALDSVTNTLPLQTTLRGGEREWCMDALFVQTQELFIIS